ncbi:Rho GTPase-activating protein 19 [Frankliniella fusca]|uniref:Rho GTPase-activating protein 19 n=1 Tax=Frankliniella fusca TaxID=407009 RepID=A0AAE1HF54_9NEOP|nr:Rho GTPase-activating protein 19 [Frankliniella fusca]
MVLGLKAEDAGLAETLRREDPEQFMTLVRMHLSFVLDLNTDECDGTVEKSGKFRPIKWSFTPFAKKAKTVNRPCIEGVSLTQESISQVYQLIQWLGQEQNLVQEGIFRRSGKMTRQQELKNMLTAGCSLNLENGQFSVHDCASVLKNFLAQLPEPLLTEAHYPAHCQIAELCSGNEEPVEEERLLKAIQLILLLLPQENMQLLKDLISLLHLTSTYAHVNKMSADNLATLFTPHLLCPRKLSPEALHTNSQTMSRVVSFMIKQGPLLFQIPAQLATDIRAYWSSREKRALLPKRDLNESTCDGMAAKTVFTFVDRERTAEASASANPTEAALAQLYAHIQSLPESTKKRKLIKQFNKENGQGTPQLVLGSHGRASRSRQRTIIPNKPRQRSRSLGESIKAMIGKHMTGFHKGFKDPKKSNDDNFGKEAIDSPRSSPVSKVKNIFQKSGTEGYVSNSSPTVMPSLKKSLVDADDEAKSLRLRLSANSKRTSASATSQNTLIDKEEYCSTSSNDSNSAGDERFRVVLKRTTSSVIHSDVNTDSKDCGPTKSPRLESGFPTPFPPTPSVERLPLSPDVKHPPGTFRDESWPVSTAPASASAVVSASSCGNLSSVGLPNAPILTPRNVLAWMTSTPAHARASQQTDSPLGNCLLTPSNATGNNSMSPITRSTQKMPKAMQEDMMTPRSRKPVVALSSSNLSQLAHLGGWGRSESGELRRDATSRATLLSEAGVSLNCKLLMKEESFTEHDAVDYINDNQSIRIPIEKMLAKEVPRDSKEHTSKPENKAPGGAEGCECCSEEKCSNCSAGNGSLDYYSCSSEGSALTGTFREIVLSRSVLTASPVDLSFSSHTGDFDSSSEREVRLSNVLSNDNLSESLLFCLDGNEPSSLNERNQCSNRLLKKTDISHTDTSSVSEKDPIDLDYESSSVEAEDETNVSCLPDFTEVKTEDFLGKSTVTNSIKETPIEEEIPCALNDITGISPMSNSTKFNDMCVQSEIDRCLSENAAVGSVNETSF